MKQRKPNGEVAELIAFVHPLVADGTVDSNAVNQIAAWLAERSHCMLPQFELLRTAIILMGGANALTPESKRALQKAIETVLPPEIRRNVKAVRTAHEIAAKVREREEREAERNRERAERAEARERNRALYRANFMVAGVSFENREFTIRNFLSANQRVLLLRERNNPHDLNAIRIGIKRWDGQTFDIGYVPRDVAAIVAPIMDKPHKYRAECTTILDKGRIPIPVVDIVLYGPFAVIETTPVATEASKGSAAAAVASNAEAKAESRIKPKKSATESWRAREQPQKQSLIPGLIFAVVLLCVAVLIAIALLASTH
jgi:hypothetical protein